MHTHPKLSFALLGLAACLLISTWLYPLFGQPSPYLAWLAATSLVTFSAYGFDKFQARHNGLRLPEIVLHGLALTGGFPGGLAGRLTFRHKTRKPVFTLVLVASAALHLGLAFFLHWL